MTTRCATCGHEMQSVERGICVLGPICETACDWCSPAIPASRVRAWRDRLTETRGGGSFMPMEDVYAEIDSLLHEAGVEP